MNSGSARFHVAVVGSGPSGFYAAEALLRSDLPVGVDMLERLPTPFGLVRSGVAPDHPRLKQVTRVYDGIARSPDFRFFGNVGVDRDVTVQELLGFYHAVILACGAQTDRRMGIPGEDLPGSHTATEFVGWFNGHPDYRDGRFDLGVEVAVIIGQGNVAADLGRILSKPVDTLRRTDIGEHALEALAGSRIRDIHIIGRRGPAQARFTPRELRELGEIPDCIPLADPAELDLNASSRAELDDPANDHAASNHALFRTFAGNSETGARRRLRFHFHLSPVEILGNGRVEALRLGRTRLRGPPLAQVAEPTGETLTMDCGLVFRSIGYHGVPVRGLPFDDERGVIPNQRGRVTAGGMPLTGVYVTGWLKRGPSGVIGTNRADSVETAQGVLADLSSGRVSARPGGEALARLLTTRGVRFLDYGEWLAIDEAEIARGRRRDKPREKFTRVEEMLACLDAPATGDPGPGAAERRVSESRSGP